MPRRFAYPSATLIVAVLAACSPAHRSAPEAPSPATTAGADTGTRAAPPSAAAAPQAPAAKPATPDTIHRIAPPEVAYAHGWMPVSSTGADRFVRDHPTYDGRGVLVGILDTGIDPTIPGLGATTTGSTKVLDLRDFSGEGAVSLTPVTPVGDSVTIGRWRLAGFGRVVALNTKGPYLAGTIAEIPLGPLPAGDLNGNGAVADTLPVVVARAPDGWVLLADTDGDGSLANERPVHDYLVARETFGWAPAGMSPKVTVAANFSEPGQSPRLDLFFETGSHGTHVAGIAAGHDIYGVAGFDGVAPGAQLLGLKIALSAHGGITTTGSMLRAMDYAIRFAESRQLPLVLNLSFGVGNEIEGQARIDSLVDSTLARHPGVVLTISAGNDGPGLSTVGLPGSARRALSVGATLPGSFLPPIHGGATPPDLLAYFSSRGGELASPDLVTPGVAYSTVPRWNAGDEIAQGTSMAAPHAAGLVALLVSALAQEKRPIDADAIRQALMVTAQPMEGQTFVDEGTGVPDVSRAYQWLTGGYRLARVDVRALGPGDATAAVLRGPVGRPDTVQSFELRSQDSAATYALRSDVPWLAAPPTLKTKGARTTVQLRVARSTLAGVGAFVGIVTGWTRDTMAGPAFRLVTTVVNASPVSSAPLVLRRQVPVPAGGTLRTFFQADSGRPFQLTVETGGRAERGLAFLHEPDGMPFRDQSARSAGFGPQAASYEADGHDVVGGAYESVVVAMPNQALTATVTVAQSPLSLRAKRSGEMVQAVAQNLTTTPVQAELALHLGGAVRAESLSARGSAVQRISFQVPAWSRGVVVDLSMDRAQWGRFTDFGVTLFDSLGRQLGKQPQNYSFGRLQVELPDGHGDMPVTLGLFPGFADQADSTRPYSLRASIRVYADTSVTLSGAGPARSVAPGASLRADFTLPESLPWTLGPKFAPLGLLLARIGERSWTQEVELPIPGAALVP